MLVCASAVLIDPAEFYEFARNEVLVNQPGAAHPARFVAVAATGERKTLVAYTPKGDPIECDSKSLPAAGRGTARWFSPRTGGMNAASPTEPAKFSPPSKDEDWVLHIRM